MIQALANGAGGEAAEDDEEEYPDNVSDAGGKETSAVVPQLSAEERAVSPALSSPEHSRVKNVRIATQPAVSLSPGRCLASSPRLLGPSADKSLHPHGPQAKKQQLYSLSKTLEDHVDLVANAGLIRDIVKAMHPPVSDGDAGGKKKKGKKEPPLPPGMAECHQFAVRLPVLVDENVNGDSRRSASVCGRSTARIQHGQREWELTATRIGADMNMSRGESRERIGR